MYILGLSAFYHDSAACLIKNGKIIAAAQEERFTRIKHDSTFPTNAIKYCLSEANIEVSDIKNVVFYEKPFLKFERLLETYLSFAPKGFISFVKAMPLWIKDKLFQKSNLLKELKKTLGDKIIWKEKLLFSEHHLSHAASAFYPSPFEKAAILTIDGVGEWTTTSYSIGNGNRLKIIKEIHFPHSLGLFYSAFTYYLGFKVNSGEYKLMGLAPYGEPKYTDVIKKELIKIHEDGSFHLNLSYFSFATGLKMTNKKFDNLFDGSPRLTDLKITQREMDIAASVQKVTEEIVVKMATHIQSISKEKNLCLAGGVALNCVANGILSKKNIFENIWIQPAAGDAGGSLGAALSIWHQHYSKPRYIYSKEDSMHGAYLGPKFTDEEIEKDLSEIGAKYNKYSENEMIEKVTNFLTNEKAIGWMQGRMEFGPRALGARSIIADPRSPNMQKQLNLKVKFRESFRPFAPSIIKEDVNEWFEFDSESPYMLFVANVKKNKQKLVKEQEKKLFGIDKLNLQRSEIPAVTHVDYSARIQTVDSKTNSKFHKLLVSFKKKTNCSILVNTSFNVRGEPIVCSPKDAFNCFMGTNLDVLVVENFVLLKDDQNPNLKQSYENLYELD